MADERPVIVLRNVGKATADDFHQLGIHTVSQVAKQDADDLYLRMCHITQTRQDPCVHDVFEAAIHEAKTGEARNWWAFTPARKVRQKSGTFPNYPG
ncbi:MAG: Mitomycin resistance protein mcrB [Armatimonadetes bacterium]|nr:Mitomycin resistance protein mcrB [Armatimonadota bacterium]